jgi:hypothetical protein
VVTEVKVDKWFDKKSGKEIKPDENMVNHGTAPDLTKRG